MLHIVSADSNKRVRADDFARIVNEHIVLPQMDAVGLGKPSDIRAIVDDEEGAGFSRPAADIAGPRQQLSIIQLLFP